MSDRRTAQAVPMADADHRVAAAAPAERMLMVWLSPGFPVGAFAFSHGLEWAVEAGMVRDRATLRTWLTGLVEHGSLRNDMVILAASHRAAVTASGSDEALAVVAELSVALQPSGERWLETVVQGNAFIAAIRAAWPCAAVEQLRSEWPGDVAYPVAVGVAAAGHGLRLPATLDAYAIAFVSALTSAAIRLSVIGQTDGQRIIADMMPTLTTAVDFAAGSSLSDLGAATWMSDLCSLAHETQYTRLFRS